MTSSEGYKSSEENANKVSFSKEKMMNSKNHLTSEERYS